MQNRTGSMSKHFDRGLTCWSNRTLWLDGGVLFAGFVMGGRKLQVSRSARGRCEWVYLESKKTLQPRHSLLVRGISLLPLVGVTPAAAEDGILSQISFGVLAHNVPVFGPQKQHGVDLNGEAQFASPVPRTWTTDVAPRWRWLV